MSEISDLEAQIARHRAELAGTVDQLADELSRAKDTGVRRAAIVGGALAAGLLVVLVVRQVRARR